MPTTKFPDFYVCRVEKRPLVPQGAEVAWLPLSRTVSAVDGPSAVASVRAELGPGVLVAVPVSQVTVASATQRIEMDSTSSTTNPIA